MSLILVVARTRPLPGTSDAASQARHRAGGWVAWLDGGIGLGADGLTVDYAASPADAVAAAQRAIHAGRREIAVIPVGGAEGAGATGISADELVELQALLAELAEQDPDGDIVLVGEPPDVAPTFIEILAVLHPSDSSDPELLAAAVKRAFGGDHDRFGRFVRAIQQGVPRGTQLALRGSAIQGYSYKTLEPFDARGPGSSDLDLVLFGDDAMAAWDREAFFIPGVNTMPLGDESTWVAPSLEPARSAAQAIARRPVNIQAMARWFMDIRSGLQGQPYVIVDA